MVTGQDFRLPDSTSWCRCCQHALTEQQIAELGAGKQFSVLHRTLYSRQPHARTTPEALLPSSAAPFNATTWRRRLRVALGQEPADLVLAGGKVVDVFAGDAYQADVAIADGVIAGIGSYPQARDRLDIAGKWISPSFIDAHVHTESALVWLPEFARAVVPHGTGAVVTDPH